MDMQKIGKFLAELRHEHNLTQEALAYELMVSRETVSKWERGVNIPATDTLLLLSKFYGVSVGEILFGERETKDNKKALENVPVEVMKVGEKKVKKILERFIILITFMLIAFLLYYFINTYNTIKVYKIDGMNDNFFIKDGLAIFSKSKSYLRIGTIESKTNITFDSFEIFIKDKNKEKVVFTSNDDNYTLLSEYGYDEIFIYKNLNIIEGNTYIKIKYQDKEDIVKLNFQRDMTNNFFTTNREKDVIEDEAKYDFDDIQKLESYVKKNWSYDNEKDCYVYTYSDSNKVKYNVLYHLNSQSLVIEEYENDLKKIVEISFVRNSLVYSEEKQENLNEKFRYDFNTQKCISGECDDEQIKYYLDNYLNKYMK